MPAKGAAAVNRKQIVPAGNRIRVLVVDDSVVIRRLVADVLEQDPEIEVVGVAANGAIALAQIPHKNPDLVTLDVEMPEMDGLETLRRIRKEYPGTRVVMFSTLTERGAAVTFEALALGADDYVAKASNVGSLHVSMAKLKEELIPKIKQFFLPPSSAPPKPAPAVAPRVGRRPRPFRPSVVAIGVSTGGPNALGEIVPLFPSDFALPVLLVQHMPPAFTALLAERLQSVAKLRVKEAVAGEPVESATIYVAPGGYHMEVAWWDGRPVIHLHQGPPENSCRPAVDVLFRSIERVYGGAALAVVLTGMGEDGCRGVEALKARGAYVIAQDEATSVVWGMPGAVVRRGLADAVLPLDRIVPEILARVAARR